MKKIFIIVLAIFSIVGCSKDQGDNTADHSQKNLSLFFISDQHAQLDNFSKIKHIVDQEKKEVNVIVVCGGDIFSGNPVVDNYEDKGYPIIDVMNSVGFDISVLGNHEFDYGDSILNRRMEQADFEWVCANIDMGSTGVQEPHDFTTISVGDLTVTFLGLIETNGKENATIPSTHPGKVENLIFTQPENEVEAYANLKEQEDSDVYIALTHLGQTGYGGIFGDYELAGQFPYFDLIIGGHSHQKVDAIVNDIPVFAAGSHLEYLGKIELFVTNKRVEHINLEFIDLNAYSENDSELKTLIDAYNSSMSPVLNEVIGFSHTYHSKDAVGCFYTDALRGKLDVDVSFQNSGGVRSVLDEGDITVKEIYEIDPFNNGTMIYTMSVSEIRSFLVGSNSGFYYSGVQIEQIGNAVQIRDFDGTIIPDTTMLSVGINDYIPAVHDIYFPASGDVQPFTTAEAIIYYLENINDQVNYPGCNHYFSYQ